MLFAIAYLLLAQAPAGVTISINALAEVIELRDQAATHHCDAAESHFQCVFSGVTPGPIEVAIGAAHGTRRVFHATAPDRDAKFRLLILDGGQWKRRWAAASAGAVALGGLGIGASVGGKPVQILSPTLLVSGLVLLVGVGMVDALPRMELVRVADSSSTGRRVYLTSDHHSDVTLVSPDGERYCRLPCELRGVPEGKATVRGDWMPPIDWPIDEL